MFCFCNQEKRILIPYSSSIGGTTTALVFTSNLLDFKEAGGKKLIKKCLWV